MTLGAVYFDYEQVANSTTRTDVEGLMTMISVGFEEFFNTPVKKNGCQALSGLTLFSVKFI